MPGYLDSNAPSPQAEYGRYIDGDILGKIIFKNFLLNRAGFSESNLYIPLSRYGDVSSDRICRADARVAVHGRWLDVEIKCARINIANKTRGAQTENWAFNNLLATPNQQPKYYDLAFVVAVKTLGLEDPKYWRYFDLVAEEHRASGRPFTPGALPHECAFLDLCCMFVVPYKDLQSNYFRVSLPAISNSRYREYYAWGYDEKRCLEVWSAAIEKCSSSATSSGASPAPAS